MVVAERLRFADDDATEEWRDFSIHEELVNGLSYNARKQLELVKTIARGFMLVTGEVGGGKDLFTIFIASIFKYFFGRKVILDFLPTRLFGDYTLMDAPTIIRKIRDIAKLYRVEGIEDSKDRGELAQFMEEATIRWLLEGEGYDIFNGSVYVVSELKKVAYNRNPMARTNKFMGSLGTCWRHLNMLLMGTHVKANEIDVKAFLEYAKLRTVCKQTLEQHVFKARVYRGQYAGPDFVVSDIAMKPVEFTINGNEPMNYLGGNRIYNLYKSKHMKFR
jgi:hypothetical protein